MLRRTVDTEVNTVLLIKLNSFHSARAVMCGRPLMHPEFSWVLGSLLLLSLHHGFQIPTVVMWLGGGG